MYGLGYGFSFNYLIYFIILMIIPLYAQYKVKGTYSRYKKIKNNSGMTGKEVAELILKANGIENIKIVKGDVELSDHYNLKDNVVVLSPVVYSQSTIASVAIAAHEIGHVIQDKIADYKPMRIRHSLVPLANLGGNLSVVLIMVGMMLTYFMSLGIGISLAWAGVFLMFFAVLFQIVTLPVEIDASNRALNQIKDLNIVNEQEKRHCKKVLTAAAFTYLAAAVVALMELVRFILIIINMSNNRD